MVDKIATSVRLDELLMDKLKIIADREKRSLNMQIEFSLEVYTSEYEKLHGKIITK
jgi:predicted transcriptional regulator